MITIMSHVSTHRVTKFCMCVVRPNRAEDIKKRCQEYTEELHKKDLHDQDNHDGMVTNLKPDTLEYEVKWVLALQTKLVEVMKFQLSCVKS